MTASQKAAVKVLDNNENKTIKKYGKGYACEFNKTAHRRIDIEKAEESVYTLANETKQMRTELNKIAGRVDVIEDRPVKRYDMVISSVVTAIIGCIVGFMITKVIGG